MTDSTRRGQIRSLRNQMAEIFITRLIIWCERSEPRWKEALRRYARQLNIAWLIEVNTNKFIAWLFTRKNDRAPAELDLATIWNCLSFYATVTLRNCRRTIVLISFCRLVFPTPSTCTRKYDSSFSVLSYLARNKI